jgi:hypothetical protein
LEVFSIGLGRFHTYSEIANLVAPIDAEQEELIGARHLISTLSRIYDLEERLVKKGKVLGLALGRTKEEDTARDRFIQGRPELPISSLWPPPAARRLAPLIKTPPMRAWSKWRPWWQKRYKAFISYRRADADAAQLVRLALERRFGKEAVFFDVNRLHAGESFSEELIATLVSSRVFVSVIGRNWLGKTKSSRILRINSESDWVRREVELAKFHNKNTVPVLVNLKGFPKGIPAEIDFLRQKTACFMDTRTADLDAQLKRIVAAVRRFA